jgi:uncharacterized protein YuzE
MKITYDKIANAMYFTLKKGTFGKTIQVNDRVLVDLGKKGEVLGIEMLDVTSKKEARKFGLLMKKGIPVEVISAPTLA